MRRSRLGTGSAVELLLQRACADLLEEQADGRRWRCPAESRRPSGAPASPPLPAPADLSPYTPPLHVFLPAASWDAILAQLVITVMYDRRPPFLPHWDEQRRRQRWEVEDKLARPTLKNGAEHSLCQKARSDGDRWIFSGLLSGPIRLRGARRAPAACCFLASSFQDGEPADKEKQFWTKTQGRQVKFNNKNTKFKKKNLIS